MERIYIDGAMATFTRKGLTALDVELTDGRSFQNLEPRRLFPISDRNKYISLLDENGVEQAIIRDLSTLPKQQQEVVADALAEYYLIPKIERILDCHERFDGITLFTQTDRGPANIEIRVLMRGLKAVGGNRVLVRDINDNRYEITDVSCMDKHSRQILGRYI